MREYQSAYKLKRHLNTLSGVYLDGVDDNIILPFEETPTAWTISLFSNHVDNGNTIYLFGYSTIGGEDIRIQLIITNTNRIFVRCQTASAPTTHTFDYVVEAGIWNHIAVTCNGTEWTLYIDGFKKETDSLLDTMDLTNIVPINCEITIGSDDNNGFFSEMLVAHHTLFDRVLTASEIYYITEHLGNIPPTANANVIHYLPLQYNTFKEHRTFNNSAVEIGVVVTQVNTFNVSDVVIDDGGTWRLANLSDIVIGIVPNVRIVIAANGSEFTVTVSGTWTSGLPYDEGALLYAQEDGTLSPIPTDFLLAVMKAGGVAQTGFTTERVAYSSVTQFNVDKAVSDVIENEYKAVISGKTWDEINYLDKNGTPRYPYANPSFYDKTVNYPAYFAGRVFNGTNNRIIIGGFDESEVDVSKAFTIAYVFKYTGNGSIIGQSVFAGSSQDKRIDIRYIPVSGYLAVSLIGNATGTIRQKRIIFLGFDIENGINGTGINVLVVSNDGLWNGELRGTLNGEPNSSFSNNLLVTDTTFTAGAMYIGQWSFSIPAWLKADVGSFQIVKGDYFGTQIFEDVKLSGDLYGKVPDADFLLALDADTGKDYTGSLILKPNTPTVTQSNAGSIVYTGKNEFKTNLPVIQHGLRLRNVNSGGSSEQNVILSNSNPFTSNDDFTIIGAFNIGDIPLNPALSDLTVVMPIGLASDFTIGTRNYLRAELVLDNTGDALEVGKFRVMEYEGDVLKGSGIKSNSDFLTSVKNTVTSIAIRRQNGIVQAFVNGMLLSDNYTSTQDFTGYTFTTGYDGVVAKSANHEFYTDFDVIVKGKVNRALSQAEIIQAHNNANLANPLLYNPYKVDGLGQNSQQELSPYHVFNKGLLYDDAGTLKVDNLLGISTTDGILNGFTDLVNARESLSDFRELRLEPEVTP